MCACFGKSKHENASYISSEFLSTAPCTAGAMYGIASEPIRNFR
jgi:hypothetical protein